MQRWGPMPVRPVFNPKFVGAKNCRICVAIADAFKGMVTVPNISQHPEVMPYYSGNITGSAKWGEDKFGLGRAIMMESQTGDALTLWSNMGVATNACMGAIRDTVYEQTFFIQTRKIETSNPMHALFGNWVQAATIPSLESRSMYFAVPLSSTSLHQAIMKVGTSSMVVTLPTNIEYNIDYIWCVNWGPRGMEVWRDGALIGSNATVATMTTGRTSGAGFEINEGWYGSKDFPLPPSPTIHKGKQAFKMFYSFDRQLEPEEIQTIFSNPYGLITPGKVWDPTKIGPLNNRITISTPVEVVAEVQSHSQTALDNVTTHPLAVAVEVPSQELSIADVVIAAVTEVLMEVSSPSQVATDTVEPSPVEVEMEVPSPGQTAADAVETSPVEVEMDVQEPSQDAQDAVEPDPVEIGIEVPSPGQTAQDGVETAPVEVLAEVQDPAQTAEDALETTPVEVDVEVPSPGQTAQDSVTTTPAEVLVEVQSTGNTALDAVVTQAVEALFAVEQPELEVSEGVTVEPVPVSIAMLVQPPSLQDVVSVITEAAVVVFGIARIDISTEDDVFYSHKQSVHNAIVAAINQGIFLPVSYDPTTRLMSVPEDESEAVPPASIAANELTCLFGLPERNRRTRIMERGSWRWQVIVRFDREVVADIFEEALLAEPILLEPDVTKSLRRITLHLVDADYTHPPRQGSSSGTQVIYTFEARLGPV